MRNIKIGSKLLLAFALLLILFTGAVFFSWLELRDINAQSRAMAEVGVAAMSINTLVERDAYELFMAMDAYKYEEDQKSWETVKSNRVTLDAHMAEAASLLRGNPDVRSMKVTMEEFGPAYAQYGQMLDNVAGRIREKEQLLAQSAKLGAEIQRTLEGDILPLGNQVLRKMIEDQDLEGIALQSTRIEKFHVLLLRFVDVRRSLFVSLSQENTESMRAIASEIETIVRGLQGLRDGIRNPALIPLYDEIATKSAAYAKYTNEFIEAFLAVEKAHDDRMASRISMNQASTQATATAQDRVRNIAESTVKALGTTIWVLLFSTGVAVIAGVAIAFLIARMITKPLSVIVGLAQRAQKGDLSIRREDFGYEGRDEVGILADAFFDMISGQRETLLEVLEVSEVSERVAKGSSHLSAVSQQTNAAMEEIKSSIEQVTGLSESNGDALQRCNASIEEMSSGADTTAQAATDTAAFITQTASASNEAVKNVDHVIQDMGVVGQKSQENEHKIRELVGAVDQIGNFVSVITGIADQTNLLALNAAIEAARAGAAGRGFAVVAEEVRKLAEDSGRAAESVSSLISKLQSSAHEAIAITSESVGIVRSTLEMADKAQSGLGEALSEMNKAAESIQSIAAVSQEQAASSREMATAIDHATHSTMDIVKSITDINHAGDETAQGAQSVAEQSQEMSNHVDRLHELLKHFKLGASSKDSLLSLPR